MEVLSDSLLPLMSMSSVSSIPVAMTIAGSDSGGGAGIQADLRTFAFHRVHGTSAITCITAQNTQGVSRVDPLPAEAVIAQIHAVVEDIGIQALKTGMLLNQEIIEAVSDILPTLKNCPIVVDPVMVSRTGAQLIDDAAISSLTEKLIPQADIVTPNRYEAELLSGLTIATLADMQAAAEKIHQLGPKAVLVKGGGMEADLRGIDVWVDQQSAKILKTETVDTFDTHGTGCTLSAAIAANLALGKQPMEATYQGKLYVTEALKHSLRIGLGQGPVGHFYPLLSS
jgi:hydroxymethylpyrimidine/phosphomethylpyrimidine kinase